MPHYEIGTRHSIDTGLVNRYKSNQPAGGAFDAYLSDAPTPGNMLQGLEGPLGYTQKSRDWTNEPGFRTKIPILQTNFNKQAEGYIDKHGFNNKKYTAGSFLR